MVNSVIVKRSSVGSTGADAAEGIGEVTGKVEEMKIAGYGGYHDGIDVQISPQSPSRDKNNAGPSAYNFSHLATGENIELVGPVVACQHHWSKDEIEPPFQRKHKK